MKKRRPRTRGHRKPTAGRPDRSAGHRSPGVPTPATPRGGRAGPRRHPRPDSALVAPCAPRRACLKVPEPMMRVSERPRGVKGTCPGGCAAQLWSGQAAFLKLRTLGRRIWGCLAQNRAHCPERWTARRLATASAPLCRQRMPASFSRASPTCLQPPSTMPEPRGSAAAENSGDRVREAFSLRSIGGPGALRWRHRRPPPPVGAKRPTAEARPRPAGLGTAAPPRPPLLLHPLLSLFMETFPYYSLQWRGAPVPQRSSVRHAPRRPRCCMPLPTCAAPYGRNCDKIC